MRYSSNLTTAIISAVSLLVFTTIPSPAKTPPQENATLKGGGGGAVSNTVGIRMTISGVDPTTNTVDLGLVMYTRGYGPSYAGSTFFGTYPAIDYGDGNTVLTVPLALTNTGGGPGGSNVYRNLTSFSHTYPALGSYTARMTMACIGCIRTSYAFFPRGSPAPNTFSYVYDYVPSSVVGNLNGTIASAGTFYSSPLSTSVRYLYHYYLIVTNTAEVNIGVASSEIPTASEWGLAALGAAHLTAGIVLLRRRAG